MHKYKLTFAEQNVGESRQMLWGGFISTWSVPILHTLPKFPFTAKFPEGLFYLLSPTLIPTFLQPTSARPLLHNCEHTVLVQVTNNLYFVNLMSLLVCIFLDLSEVFNNLTTPSSLKHRLHLVCRTHTAVGFCPTASLGTPQSPLLDFPPLHKPGCNRWTLCFLSTLTTTGAHADNS